MDDLTVEGVIAEIMESVEPDEAFDALWMKVAGLPSREERQRAADEYTDKAQEIGFVIGDDVYIEEAPNDEA